MFPHCFSNISKVALKLIRYMSIWGRGGSLNWLQFYSFCKLWICMVELTCNARFANNGQVQILSTRMMPFNILRGPLFERMLWHIWLKAHLGSPISACFTLYDNPMQPLKSPEVNKLSAQGDMETETSLKLSRTSKIFECYKNIQIPCRYCTGKK